MARKNNLIAGVTDLLVLSILDHKDNYAYEISKYIASQSDALLSMSMNTVYTVIYKLESKNMVTEYTKLVGKKRTRVYYHLEPAGKEYLDKLRTNYDNMVKGVSLIFEDLASPEESE